jgi:hypothetical protein
VIGQLGGHIRRADFFVDIFSRKNMLQSINDNNGENYFLFGFFQVSLELKVFMYSYRYIQQSLWVASSI